MENRILPVIMVAMLMFTGMGVIATDSDDDHGIKILEKHDLITFSDATINAEGEYVSINIDEATTFLRDPGKPMTPVVAKTFKFPLGTKIKGVECSISDVEQQVISGKIKPAPKSMPLLSVKQSNQGNGEDVVEDSSVYSDSGLYPDKWHDYNIGVGLDRDQRVIFVTIYCYPVRYSPAEDTIYSIESVDVKVTYEEGTNPLPSGKKCDLVIITPRRFYLGVLPLKLHKERMGISTKIKTTESIYWTCKGRDRPEKIKHFIQNAIENWDVKYVLLVGGPKGLGLRWNVPVRHSNLEDGALKDGYSIGWNETHISDLYYADIYKWNETNEDWEFDNWDSNGNGVFAEWIWTWYWNDTNHYGYWTWPIVSKDILDLHPDVYVGRLACNNIRGVRTVVKKIIRYETSTYDQGWFKEMIVAGGDTEPLLGDSGVYEGEIENELAASYMEPLGFNITRLWTSDGTLTNTSLKSTIDEGAGFLYCSGHGNPIIWCTHVPDSEEWVDALFSFEMNSLRNGKELPVCVVGGCHNSQFDVAPINFFKGLLKEGLRYFHTPVDENDSFFGSFWTYEWTPNCWSWNLVRQKNGGSIATIGNTGIGHGYIDEYSTIGLDGWITTHFFQVYSENVTLENCTLGMVHSGTINDYVINFDPNHDYNVFDRKTVEQWVLLGDPSLKIGGYP